LTLLLTATARQARFLRDRWATVQLEQEIMAWETPPILSVQAWMRQQWDRQLQQGMALPHLLTPDQERRAWQQSLPHQLLEESHFLRQGDLLNHAMVAYRTFYLWREEGELMAHALVDTHLEELELFHYWSQAFEQRCEMEQWLPGVALSGWVVEALEEGTLPYPPTISHYQYHNWNRAEQRLLSCMERLGAKSVAALVPPRVAECGQTTFVDPDAEMNGVAAWLYHTEGQQRPNTSVGVVVPGLQGRRERLDRCFGQTLVPESALYQVPESQLPYRFSVGYPLLEVPLVHHALQLLRLLNSGLQLLDVTALLRSPWLLQGAEMEARAQFDLRLREWGNSEVTLTTLLRLLEPDRKMKTLAAPRFLGALRALEGLVLAQLKQSTTEWAASFSRVMAFFEWAESAAESGAALAAYNGWREGLERFVALGEIVGELSLSQAIRELSQLLSGIELDSFRGGRRAIEILTPEEAEGVQFDALWVMGCDDQQWPSAPTLSPFLPIAWQRQRLPNGERNRALGLAHAQLQQLAQAAPQVTFSFARSSEVGGEPVQRVTPLLGIFPVVDDAEQRAGEEWWLGGAPLVWESIPEQNIALPTGRRVRGGSALLGDQSQCPFRAFVRHRLQARRLEQPQPGLDARERGTLLHQLLEQCWHALEGKSAILQGMEETLLESLVERAAEQVVGNFQHLHPGRFGHRFAANESQRLTRLALRALYLDRQRVQPFRVEEMERQYEVSLEGFTMTIKMDRVDQLEDGRRILIDYKSGRVSHAEWAGERPKAPQLPLYATLLEDVAAVLFSQILADEVVYKGEQAEAAVMEGAAQRSQVRVSEAWSAQLAEWQSVITALATEFSQGVALVTPLNGQSGCRYCGLEPLCRVEFG